MRHVRVTRIWSAPVESASSLTKVPGAVSAQTFPARLTAWPSTSTSRAARSDTEKPWSVPCATNA